MAKKSKYTWPDKPPRFKVGEWVALRRPFGPKALVIGDRGPLGVDGEHMYRIREVYEWGYVKEYEQLEQDLEPADPPADAPRPDPAEWGPFIQD